MARLPANGLTVSHDHCVMGSSPIVDGVVNTLWEKKWENPANRAVTTKNYLLSGNTVTDVRLVLFPVNREGITDQTAETEIQNTTSASIEEMLISIAKGQNVIVNGKTHTVKNKVFSKNGNNWNCALWVKDSQGTDFALRTDVIDQNTMIHAAKLSDLIYSAEGKAQVMRIKTFKEVRPNEYEVSAVTTTGGSSTYITTRNIDWNAVFLTAQRGDNILISNRTYTVSHKICDVTRSNEIYVTPYLEAN